MMNIYAIFHCLTKNTTETGWVDDSQLTPHERQVSRAEWMRDNARNNEEAEAAALALEMLGGGS